jgi:hypothetical protein
MTLSFLRARYRLLVRKTRLSRGYRYPGYKDRLGVRFLMLVFRCRSPSAFQTNDLVFPEHIHGILGQERRHGTMCLCLGIRSQIKLGRDVFDRITEGFGQQLNGLLDLKYMTEDQKDCLWGYHIWVKACKLSMM